MQKKEFRIVYFNSIVVFVEHQSERALTIGSLLHIVEIDIMIEIYEIYGNILKCISLGDTIRIIKDYTVNYYSPSFVFEYYDELFGSIVNPLGEVMKTVHSNIKQTNKTTLIESRMLNESTIRTASVFIETGIKTIDFFAPYLYGGKIGVFGGAGTGKTSLIAELLSNLRKMRIRSIFCGVGERIREGLQFYDELHEAGLLVDNDAAKSSTALIYGTMDQHPAIRSKAGWAGLLMAEYMRDIKNQNIILMVDNAYRLIQAENEISASMKNLPSDAGYQPDISNRISKYQNRIYSSYKTASITSMLSIYVPADDYTDPAVQFSLKHLDTKVILRRELAAQNIYPAIDPYESSSRGMISEIVGDYHYNTYMRIMQILHRYKQIENIVSIVGVEGLTDADAIVYRRAKLIYSFITQPLGVAQNSTLIPGVVVPSTTTISSFAKIADGELDDRSPDDLYYIGGL